MIVCHALFFCKVRNDRKMASFGVEFMNFYVNFRKNLKNSKNLQIFLKNFIRGAKTTLCVAGLCYNEIV